MSLARKKTWAHRVAAALRTLFYALVHRDIFHLAAVAAQVMRREGFTGVKRRFQRLQNFAQSASQKSGEDIDLYPLPLTRSPVLAPKVSVIVPNYNHAPYLRKRLESIYGQTYKNFDVILLDDGSTDGSREILLEYANRFPDKTRCDFNAVNSGGVFHQWKKGLALATGDLVWIAESDDDCTDNLLAELVKYFENQAVMLAFCRSDFVKNGTRGRISSLEEYWRDIDLNRWETGFIKSAHWLVNHGWAVKNILPNASSAVFRHPGKLDLLDTPAWTNMKLCGDWIFYLTIIRGGLVAYTPKATNFYTIHSGSTSTNVQKSDVYYQEHEVMAKTLVSLYRLNPGLIEQQQAHLYEHWKMERGEKSLAAFQTLYNPGQVRRFAENRKPNLVMVAYALTAGGGETFPILLANLFKAEGYAVTFFNAKQEPSEPGIRAMLRSNVPLLELDRSELTAAVLGDMGAEIVHTHHADLDIAFATYLAAVPAVKQIVTLHGMYETMQPKYLAGILPVLTKRIDRFVYTAEKNLPPFPPDFRAAKGFVRINNALPPSEIHPVPRRELGIANDDFVLCLVARAIPEKGWREAIQAVQWAQQHSVRKIHLLLIGEGMEYDRLKPKTADNFVHFLGFRDNIRDYFAAADMGFLPSRYKSESFPLVLMDCLLAGRPLLASNIGEIAAMLSTRDGMAGEIFDLEDWMIPVHTVGKLIVGLANDPARYQALLQRVSGAAAKFDVAAMVKAYDAVYQSCFDTLKKSEECNA